MPSDDPPTDALMILDTEQPEPMCKGAKAKYVCDAGGVNVREVRTIIDKLYMLIKQK